MAIKIIKKSNKTKTLSKSSHDAGETVPPGNLAKSLIPFIDKISVVVTPANEEHAYAIHSGIWTQFNDTSVFQSPGISGKKSGGYSTVKLISLSSTDRRVLLQYRHADHKAEKLRLEFNPRKIGETGLMELHAVLTSVIPEGWGYVVAHGRITRIDIAVDVQDVRMDEFLFLPKQATTVLHWTVDGHLETLRMGNAKGNQTLIYSVKQKRLSKHQPWNGPSKIRIERRLRNPHTKKLTDLGVLKNPFGDMVMTMVMPAPPPGENEKQWSMFEDSVHVRKLGPALALLPAERRTKYRAHLAKYPHPWWKPQEIWEKWPTAYQPLLSGLK